VINLTHDVWIHYLSRGFGPYDYVRGLIVHRSAPLIFVLELAICAGLIVPRFEWLVFVISRYSFV
jgi:hypothetical protein